MRDLLFTTLDWVIAWRHLRAGDERPAWVRPLLFGSIYLIVIGALLSWHASTLDAGNMPTIIGPLDAEVDMGPTPLERWYGTFGGFTLIVGIMALVFGVLAWSFSLLPTIITMSVLLGCMAMVVVLSLMSGLEGDLRDKILNQKAHIRVAREDGRPFDEYEGLADALGEGEGIAGASPYLEGEIMVRSGLNRQGAVLAGILPKRQTEVSNLHSLMQQGDYAFLTDPSGIPEPDPFAFEDPGTPYRLRHLEKEREKENEAAAASAPAKRPSSGVVNKLPSVVELNDDGGEAEAELEEGWEDPVVELGSKDEGDELPPKAAPKAPPAGPTGLLGDIPSVAERLAADELGERPLDDGWEDPVEELPELRDQPPSEDDPAEDSPGELEDLPPPPDELGELDDAPADPILIGRELSMELGVRVGVDVQLITPIGRTTPAGEIPGVLEAKVAGVFFSGMYEYDRKNVYAPLSMVQRFLLTGDRVTGIEVKLDDVEAIDEGKAEVEAIVAASGRDGELIVEDWRDLNRNLFSAMFLEKVAMFIALLFVVLVASFGILASNLMSVMEKSKEIAILKAMGTSDAGIMRVFVAEGLCVGLLGSGGGIAMGLGLCWALDRYGLPLNENLYYIQKLPVVVNPVEVALVGIAALTIVCLSSIYPALVASRLRPVDALRQGDH